MTLIYPYAQLTTLLYPLRNLKPKVKNSWKQLSLFFTRHRAYHAVFVLDLCFFDRIAETRI